MTMIAGADRVSWSEHRSIRMVRARARADGVPVFAMTLYLLPPAVVEGSPVKRHVAAYGFVKGCVPASRRSGSSRIEENRVIGPRSL